jgi:hypothetical protein
MFLRLATLFLRFKRDQRGLAYLEFAICTPFLLALLMGAIEVTRYILIAQKVEKVAVTISDVVAQGSTISNAQLDTIIAAAQQVMLPYSFGANGYVIISSVKQTGTPSSGNPPRVSWQYTGGGTWVQTSHVGSPGTSATLPSSIALNNKDNIIIAEVFYNFRPLVTLNGVISQTSIYKFGLFKPRLGDLSTLSAIPLFWLPQKGAML